jgi:hypothetical protein
LFLKKSKNVSRMRFAGQPFTSYLSASAAVAPLPVAGAGAGAVCGPFASYVMGVTHLGTTPTALTNSGAAKTDSSHASVAGNGFQSSVP